MAEFVIGAGHQKSVRPVVAMVEKHLLRTEGVPRQIRAWSNGFEVVAERPEFSGEFDRFTLRLRHTDKGAAGALQLATDNSSLCAIKEETDTFAIQCPAPGELSTPETRAFVDRLSEALTLPETWHAEGDQYRIDRISVELLFQAMLQYKASDVHVSPGCSPVFRVDGDTRTSELLGAVSAVQITALIQEVAEERYWREFVETKQTSFNFHQVGLGYSRVSAFIKAGSPHITFRFLPEKIPSFEDLNIPRGPMEKLAKLHRGLLLLVGMTGSGKSTTVAALTDWINEHRCAHILTIENPVEYVHTNKKSIISQRCLGQDVATFNLAVTGALRHDPDVIVIGEMRDPDTIRSAINAAATGHLVISTLHANTASEVVNRIVSFFNPVERDLVRLQLRDCLQCVICQRLVPKVGGGRVPALEIMFSDVKAIKDGIMEGDTDHIRAGMQQTISHSFLFEHYLYNLYKQGDIDIQQARIYATEPSLFDQINMGTYSVPRLEGLKQHH